MYTYMRTVWACKYMGIYVCTHEINILSQLTDLENLHFEGANLKSLLQDLKKECQG